MVEIQGMNQNKPLVIPTEMKSSGKLETNPQDIFPRMEKFLSSVTCTAGT